MNGYAHGIGTDMDDLGPIPYTRPSIKATKCEVTEAGEFLIEFSNGTVHKLKVPSDPNMLVKELEYFAQRIRHDWHLFDTGEIA